jgi:hypothetical protein
MYYIKRIAMTTRITLSLLFVALLSLHCFAESHYLDRYEPLGVWTLNHEPTSKRIGDTKGIYNTYLHGDKKSAPQIVDSARDFLGQAWDFAETSSSLAVPTSGPLEKLGDIHQTRGISLSFWIKAPKSVHKQNYRIINHPAAEVVMAGWGYGAIGFHFGRNYHIGYTKYSKDKDIIFDGHWHHLVATVDFSARRNSVKIYLDGRLSTQNDGKANSSFNFSGHKKRLHIGARSNGGHVFSGALDDVAIFDYPLSPKQVQEIYHGPVYAGPDLDVYLPDVAQLNAIVPEQSHILWNKVAGPGSVVFEDPSQAQTTAHFSQVGDYQLQIRVNEGATSQLNLKVHPPTAPVVDIGDPLRVLEIHKGQPLQAKISLPGQPEGALQGVSYLWEKVDGAGNVTFSSPKSKESSVSFDEEGLYRLRLSAARNGLTGFDELSVVVGRPDEQHYAQLLNPIYLLPLNDPANRESAGIRELAGGTCAAIKGNTDKLPQMITGAREYTRSGWDFEQRNCSISVHNRFHLAQLGNIELTKGLSASFWVRGNQFNHNIGRIGGFQGLIIVTEKESQGVSVDIMGVGLSTKAAKDHGNLFDKEWHHVVATADFSSDKNNLRLYIDGKLVDQKSQKITESMSSTRTDHTHHWAKRSNGNGAFFNGQLDDIAMFDRALHADEVSYLFHGPSAEQLKRLELPAPMVQAGSEQVHRLPRQSITLNGQASGPGEIQSTWELIRGPGKVRFSNQNALTTEVHFEPISQEHHNPDYREYIFRLTAKGTQGPFAKSGSDEVSIVLYQTQAPATRNLGSFPVAGVHPRLFFSPEDLAQWRETCKADPIAMAAVGALKARNKNAFSSSEEMGAVYEKLKNKAEGVDVKIVVGNNDTRSYWNGSGHMYACLAGSALVALLEDDKAKLKELGIVLSGVAKSHLSFYRPNYGNKLVHDASGGLALAYDFTAAHMNEELRQPVRKLLSKMTKWRQTLGSATTNPRQNSSNWFTHHDQLLLAALVIEGEEGDDPMLIKKAKSKLRTFLSQFGLFKSGYPHEGFGYYLMGMESAALSALALSRRGENLYETTNLYNNARMMFRSMPPGCDFISNHGDTGPRVEGHAQPLNWVLRSLWPKNAAIRYLSDKRLQAMKAKGGRNFDRSLNLMSVLFPVQARPAITQKEAAQALELPLSEFCPDKGYSNFRSSWDDDAVNLVFRVQHDKYNVGHGHPDVNSFELYHNGTTWFLDPGKYNSYNDCHQTVLIDGIGANGSSALKSWPYLPGHYMEYADKGKFVFGVGNAKLAYDFSPSNSNGKLEQVKDVNVGSIWADFVYGKTRADLATMPHWRSHSVANFLHTSGKFLYRYNPVQRAYRSAALVRGVHPYVVIVDDIQKDDQNRSYQWIGNLAYNSAEVVSQSGKDLIIKKSGDLDQGNRLLVKVLQADGLVGSPELVHTEIGGKKVTQVRITSNNVITPNFKILLYPFKEGQELPQTRANSSRSHIKWPEGSEVIDFSQDEDGRTHLNVR